MIILFNITLHLHWHTLLVWLLLLYLIYRACAVRKGYGYIDLSGLEVIFWLFLALVVVAVYGGIVWW